MRVRRAEGRDLPSILAIENICFSQEIAFPEQMLAVLLKHAITLAADEGRQGRIRTPR
ncbi:MAG: hypothetical protein ACXQT4_01575 [Methanotrichaceae archaeon]